MYKLFNDPIRCVACGVQRLADKIFIPFDTANADYREYLAWLEAGNTPLPAEGQ